MTCEAARAELLDYVEDELDTVARESLQEHLATCEGCSEELREIERLRSALRRERVPDPGTAFWEKFPDQVWRAYQAEVSAVSRSGWAAWAANALARIGWTAAPGAWMPAAAALVAVVGVALFFALQTGTPGIGAFQAKIRGGENLALVQRSLAGLPADNRFAFSAPGKVDFFRIGHEYAASLAFAAGGDSEAARLRLVAIAELGASGRFAELARGSPSVSQIAALEPELVQMAARAGARETALFRVAGWLANISLALAARDKAALREAAPEVLRLRRDLEPGGAPPGALRDLDALGRLLASSDLSDRDYAEAARLIREIQLMLI